MATSADALIGSLLQQPGLIGQAFQQARTAAGQQAQNAVDVQLGQQQVQANQQAFAAQAQAQQQQQQFGQWWQDYASNPTPDKLRQGIALFPQQAKAIQDQSAALDAPARQSRELQLGQLYNAAKNGRADLVGSQLDDVIAAEQKAGIDTKDAEQVKAALASGDKDALKGVVAFTQAHLALSNPDFARTLGIGDRENHYTQLGSGGLYDQRTGEIIRQPDDAGDKVEYKTIKNADGSESIVAVGGGDRASTGGGAVGGSGGPAGSGGDVSRLINTDAGGGYVPAGIKTLGQFVAFGKSLNARGAKSSSAGTYQINGSTMAEFAPKALGADWKQQPFNADSQEKVGEAIFNWAKRQPNPAAALRGRWVSLSPSAAAQAVKGSWDQARATIAQGETGGGPAASAAQVANSSGGVSAGSVGRVVYTSQGGSPDAGFTPEEQTYLAQQVANGAKLSDLGISARKEDAPIRRKIIAQSIDLNIDRHLNGFQANLLRADLKANTHSLTQLAGVQTAVAASERTASMNADQVLKLAPAGVGGSTPIFNRWIQSGRSNVAGDPAVSRFNLAIDTLANEYAKVMTTNTGTGGATSDSARDHARELLNRNQTLPQLRGTIAQMKIDMHNRQTALETQRGVLNGQITSPAGTVPAPNAPAAPSGFRVLRVRPK